MQQTSYKHRYVDSHPDLSEYKWRGQRFDEFLKITGLTEHVGEWPDKHKQIGNKIQHLDHVTLFFKGSIPFIMNEPYYHIHPGTGVTYVRIPQIIAPYHGVDLNSQNHTGSFLYTKLVHAKYLKEIETRLLKAAAEKPQIEFDDYLEGAS